jgi:hypothetical protein
MNHYYDQRLLALESLIYQSKSTDIYTEKWVRMGLEEAKQIRKAFIDCTLKTQLEWHLVFLNDFIDFKGFQSKTLTDYARLLNQKGYKTKKGLDISGGCISCFLTEIRSRYGLLKFKSPKPKTCIERIKEFSLKEWDYILSKVNNPHFITVLYRIYLYGYDDEFVEDRVGKNNFKSFVSRSVRILSHKKSDKDTKKK